MECDQLTIYKQGADLHSIESLGYRNQASRFLRVLWKDTKPLPGTSFLSARLFCFYPLLGCNERPLCCSTSHFRYQRIFRIVALLILGHVERNNHAFPDDTLFVVQEAFQDVLNSFLFAETSQSFGCLVSDHAFLVKVAQLRRKSRNGSRMRQLAENESDLVPEQSRFIGKTSC